MKEIRAAAMITMLGVLLTGFAFPAIIYAMGQILFPADANGSFIRNAEGRVVGSSLIGQAFKSARYFHPRPSAAGSGYDGANSGGTNLGPISRKLVEGVDDDPATADVDESYPGIQDLAAAYRQENMLASDAKLPADAVTRSASGLDPHISPQNAMLQAGRIAQVREVPAAAIGQLIAQHTEERYLGLFGERRVNVLVLNLALEAIGRPQRVSNLGR